MASDSDLPGGRGWTGNHVLKIDGIESGIVEVMSAVTSGEVWLLVINQDPAAR